MRNVEEQWFISIRYLFQKTCEVIPKMSLKEIVIDLADLYDEQQLRETDPKVIFQETSRDTIFSKKPVFLFGTAIESAPI